jgi:acetoacetyl-CoA synthetase
MIDIQEGDLLWEPSTSTIEQANMTHYVQWLAENKALTFETYQALWRWSVEHVADFWKSLWDYFQITASEQPTEILADDSMPGAKWFTGAKLNYAENFFARIDEAPAKAWRCRVARTQRRYPICAP